MTKNIDGPTKVVDFVVNARNRSALSSFQQREKDVTCIYCGKYGHAQSDCFQLKGLPEWWAERGREFGDRGRDFSERGRGGTYVKGTAWWWCCWKIRSRQRIIWKSKCSLCTTSSRCTSKRDKEGS